MRLRRGGKTDRFLQISNKGQRSRLAEILPHDHPQQFDLVGMWSESVCWNDPSSLSKMSSDSEFVESSFGILLQSPGDERETSSTAVGENLEQLSVIHILDFVGKSIADSRQGGHDSSVPTLAESKELLHNQISDRHEPRERRETNVVLSDDLGSAFTEIKSHARLRRAKIVDLQTVS